MQQGAYAKVCLTVVRHAILRTDISSLEPTFPVLCGSFSHKRCAPPQKHLNYIETIVKLIKKLFEIIGSQVQTNLPTTGLGGEEIFALLLLSKLYVDNDEPSSGN